MATSVHDHQVAFYDTEDRLAEVVSGFVAATLHRGDAAVVVATTAHRKLFRAALARDGIDVDLAMADGRYIVLDAASTLGLIMDGERLRGSRFRSMVGDVLDTAAAGGRAVSVYGEMVALLWADGLVPVAIELEDLWNDLGGSRRFSLLCAYPTSVFEGEASTEAFRTVCAQHSEVIASDTTSRLDDAMVRTLLERKQTELEDALRRLHEIDEMRTKFLAMVVHDIRTPAVVVRGYLSLLAETWTELDESQIREFLSTSAANVAQIERLADDMNTVSRLESGTFSYDVRPINLTGLVHRVADDTRIACERTIDTTDVGAQPRVLADERRQMQILTNLLSNAVKFSPSWSTVTVSIEHGASELVVRVSDQGPGLSATEVGQLFRPFARLTNTATRSVKGTGLGLFITRSLVEGQGGAIWVESEPGEGATFAYSVPLA